MNKKRRIEVFESSGNVFEDLGIPNAEECLAKSSLALQIDREIEDLGEASKILKVPQSTISLIIKGKLNVFTLEDLSNFLNELKQRRKL